MKYLSNSSALKAAIIINYLLLQFLSRLFSEVEELSSKLQSESDLLGQFYKELEELQVWTSDTKSMLGSGSHSNGVATSAQPLTSVAQLRGKHQVGG